MVKNKKNSFSGRQKIHRGVGAVAVDALSRTPDIFDFWTLKKQRDVGESRDWTTSKNDFSARRSGWWYETDATGLLVEAGYRFKDGRVIKCFTSSSPCMRSYSKKKSIVE